MHVNFDHNAFDQRQFFDSVNLAFHTPLVEYDWRISTEYIVCKYAVVCINTNYLVYEVSFDEEKTDYVFVIHANYY